MIFNLNSSKYCQPYVQLTLGGLKGLEVKKNSVRRSHGLPCLSEDVYAVCETMRPASPPASAADLIEHQVPRRGARAGKRVSLLFRLILAVVFDKVKNIIILCICNYLSASARKHSGLNKDIKDIKILKLS